MLPGPADDPRWQLAQRIAASRELEGSPRLRELLLFLARRSLSDPSRIAEGEVAAAVFGRSPPDRSDPLVRVHGSRLRRCLARYAHDEGAADPLTLELPTGGYRLVFRVRSASAPAAQSRASTLARRLLTGALALAIVWPAWRAPGSPVSAEGRAPLHVERLWRQMFGDGRPVSVVLADSNLSMLQEVLGRQLSLAEYQGREFAAPGEGVPGPPARLLERLMYREFTSLADARAAQRIGGLGAAYGIPIQVLSARDVGPDHFRDGHAVLTGPRRANPWVEMFEPRLNFRASFDESRETASFVNESPLPGEAARYVVAWNRRGYCRVAYLPSLSGAGSVLLLSGTEMGSTEAGIELLTHAGWLERLRVRLGLSRGDPFPCFEVLLATELVSSSAARFELVAHRIVPSAPIER